MEVSGYILLVSVMLGTEIFALLMALLMRTRIPETIAFMLVCLVADIGIMNAAAADLHKQPHYAEMIANGCKAAILLALMSIFILVLSWIFPRLPYTALGRKIRYY